MHREPILRLLAAHHPFDDHERAMLREIETFVRAHADCFQRSLSVGHITGSAWVLDRDSTHVLLTHHAKLDCWLQLGGHADGDSDVLGVALREAREESGLSDIVPISPAIFDVDIHRIPARGTEPEHFHYDIRFALRADRSQPLIVTSESKELRWVALGEIEALHSDRSVMRMVRKS